MTDDCADNLRVPKRLQIETIHGCNARCVMCALSVGYTRKTGIMNADLFRSVVDLMAPYCDHVEKVDLFAMGEPLLDPHLFERIWYVRDKGFSNLSIATNGDLLDLEKQKRLLDSEIETVIFSIDGIDKQTHESIRPGVSFERVVDNCQSIIQLRDEGNYNTRFIIRFIRQDINVEQWETFQAFWLERLSPDRSDKLIAYDVNTMGGEITDKMAIIGGQLDEEIERRPCHQVFDRLIVLTDGTVPLCCEDTPRARYVMGNIKEASPMEIFNGQQFNRIRQIHQQRNKRSLPICKECTLLYSESAIEVH